MMGPKVSLLLLATLLSVVNLTHGGSIICQNPIEINLLRNYMCNTCVNLGIPHGTRPPSTGIGLCYANDRFVNILCDDGTIRVAEEPSYCLTLHDDGEVDHRVCEVFPETPASQLWDVKVKKIVKDVGGIDQKGLHIINRKDGKILSPSVFGLTQPEWHSHPRCLRPAPPR